MRQVQHRITPDTASEAQVLIHTIRIRNTDTLADSESEGTSVRIAPALGAENHALAPVAVGKLS